MPRGQRNKLIASTIKEWIGAYKKRPNLPVNKGFNIPRGCG